MRTFGQRLTLKMVIFKLSLNSDNRKITRGSQKIVILAHPKFINPSRTSFHSSISLVNPKLRNSEFSSVFFTKTLENGCYIWEKHISVSIYVKLFKMAMGFYWLEILSLWLFRPLSFETFVYCSLEASENGNLKRWSYGLRYLSGILCCMLLCLLPRPSRNLGIFIRFLIFTKSFFFTEAAKKTFGFCPTEKTV
jgi:hypothetical protein